MEDVASFANLTTVAFCRYFKKYTGITFINYLNQVRIQKACRMLLEKESVAISTVAYSCGFNSITNFNRVFMKTIGITPSYYCKTHKSNQK
ncbi:helix-turn-helix domain-containing protein [Sphingobacterium sp. UBA5980]|uniref:helix-turn-helix domain-containing protein n=1 Tax=Sphingobacterium sp. UBA5980 TaxID=1947504 RepID=UPI0039C8F58F